MSNFFRRIRGSYFARIVIKQLFSYLLVALISVGLVGCSPDQLSQDLSQYGTFWLSDDKQELVGFGMIPQIPGLMQSGKLLIGSILNTGSGYNVTMSATDNVESTEKLLIQLVVQRGMSSVSWLDLSKDMQSNIMLKLQEAYEFSMMLAARGVSAPIMRSIIQAGEELGTAGGNNPTFGLMMVPAWFTRNEDGTILPDGCFKLGGVIYCPNGIGG